MKLSDETETSFLVDGAGIYLGAGSLFGRKRFAGEHALVHIGTAFIYGSVHGNAAARFDYQSLPLLYLFYGNFFQLSFRSENGMVTVAGCSPISFLMASDVFPLAFSSSNRPSRIKEMMTLAASK